MTPLVLYFLAFVCVDAVDTDIGLFNLRQRSNDKGAWETYLRTSTKNGKDLDNSIFASVFSARMNVARRNMTRFLWERKDNSNLKPAFKEASVMSFAVCKYPPATGEEKWVGENLRGEALLFNDIDFLDCHEGQGFGQMREKAVKAMRSFYADKNNNQKLFLHIEDDTFVPWNRLWVVLNTLGDLSHLYMGEEIPEGKAVNRDKQSLFYQPEAIYSPSSYPKHMARHCIILGRQLVSDMIESNIMDRMPLTNLDQSFGVWADELKKSGANVEILPFDPPTKNPDGFQIHYSACGEKWSRYPFLWQHGLKFENMQCLGAFDAAEHDDSIPLDTCLSDCNAVR